MMKPRARRAYASNGVSRLGGLIGLALTTVSMIASWLRSTAFLHLTQREPHASLDEQRGGAPRCAGCIGDNAILLLRQLADKARHPRAHDVLPHQGELKRWREHADILPR